MLYPSNLNEGIIFQIFNATRKSLTYIFSANIAQQEQKNKGFFSINRYFSTNSEISTVSSEVSVTKNQLQQILRN